MLKNHFTLNANTQYKSSCNHHNETGRRFLGSKQFRLRGILRCSIPLSVVAKVTYDKRQLASQAFRQILKHLLSSELEEVLHYLSVACRRLPFIVLTLARYHSYSTVAGDIKEHDCIRFVQYFPYLIH